MLSEQYVGSVKKEAKREVTLMAEKVMVYILTGCMLLVGGLFTFNLIPGVFVDAPEWLSYLVGAIWIVGGLVVLALDHVK